MIIKHIPLVSIIIPVYNSEKFLRQAIQSAKDQTWSHKELIIVDDGSEDNSLEIARSFDGENIRIIKQKNKGASAARNMGLQHAKGDYIQFLDADDMLSPNKISAQLALLRDFPFHLGLCGTVYFNDGDDPIGQAPYHTGYSAGSDNPVDFLIKLYGGNLIEQGFGGMIQPNAWLTPREIIDKAGIWNTKITLDDDGEFFCRVVLASKGVKYSEEAINYYRKHPYSKSLSGRTSYEAYKNMLEGNKLKLSNLLSHTTSSKAKLAMCRIFWENCFTFYPVQRKLAIEASRMAKSLDNSFQYNPYVGIKYHLANLIGWKRVKKMQHLKHKILLSLGLRR